jgi:hypothetical protein
MARANLHPAGCGVALALASDGRARTAAMLHASEQAAAACLCAPGTGPPRPAGAPRCAANNTHARGRGAASWVAQGSAAAAPAPPLVSLAIGLLLPPPTQVEASLGLHPFTLLAPRRAQALLKWPAPRASPCNPLAATRPDPILPVFTHSKCRERGAGPARGPGRVAGSAVGAPMLFLGAHCKKARGFILLPPGDAAGRINRRGRAAHSTAFHAQIAWRMSRRAFQPPYLSESSLPPRLSCPLACRGSANSVAAISDCQAASTPIHDHVIVKSKLVDPHNQSCIINCTPDTERQHSPAARAEEMQCEWAPRGRQGEACLQCHCDPPCLGIGGQGSQLKSASAGVVLWCLTGARRVPAGGSQGGVRKAGSEPAPHRSMFTPLLTRAAPSAWSRGHWMWLQVSAFFWTCGLWAGLVLGVHCQFSMQWFTV